MPLNNVRVGIAAERPAADRNNKGLIYVATDTSVTSISTGDEYLTLSNAALGAGENVAQGTQQADIADADAPAALTSAQITGGEDPTEAEYNLLQADVDALRSTVDSIVTKLNSVLDVLDEYGQTA